MCSFTTAKQNKNIYQSLMMKSFLFVKFYVSFCTQLIFVSHLQEDFCIVHDHILACFFILWISIGTFYKLVYKSFSNFFGHIQLIKLCAFLYIRKKKAIKNQLLNIESLKASKYAARLFPLFICLINLGIFLAYVSH